MVLVVGIEIGLEPYLKFVFYLGELLFVRFLPIVGSLVGFFPSDGRQLLWVLVADEFLENLYSLSELSNFSIYINRFASLSEPSVLGNFVDVSV